MESINFVLCIVYLILGLLNVIGLIKIEDSAVFAMTVGTLFLCISPLFDSKNIRVILYIIAASFIVGFQLISGSNELVKGVDNNTWMLLSLSVTFLANYLGKVKRDRLDIKNRGEDLKRKSSDIKLLKNEINRLKTQIDTMKKE